MTHPSTFEQFRDDALSRGFHEALVREWAAGQENSLHEHPFDTYALVVRGEFWLTVEGRTRHLRAGDTFELARQVPHSERYGPQGATFWAARVNPMPAQAG
jgi:quercetin dioxygenase-like cupin family protein